WGSSSQGSSVGQAKAVSGSGQSLHWNAHDAGSEPRTSSTLWPPPVPLELLLLDALLLLLAEDVLLLLPPAVLLWVWSLPPHPARRAAMESTKIGREAWPRKRMRRG